MKKYIRASISESAPDWLRKKLATKNMYNPFKVGLLKKGIRLSSANFTHERPVDMDNALTVYYLSTDYGPTVYAPGVNDDQTEYINGRNRRLGSIARSKLNDIAYDVVYLDLNDPDTRNLSKSKYEDPRYEYSKYTGPKGKYAGQKWDDYRNKWNTLRGDRDKSGYKLRSPEEMIAEYYEKFPGRVTDKINSVYDRILDVRNDLINADFNKPFDRGRWDSNIHMAYHYFSYVVENYQKLLSNLGTNNRLKRDWFATEYIQFSKDISRINEYLDDVEKFLYADSNPDPDHY